MPTPIFHLEINDTPRDYFAAREHHYYRTLSALYNDKGSVTGVSLSFLQKYDFKEDDFVNGKVAIYKGSVLNTKEVLAKKIKRKK